MLPDVEDFSIEAPPFTHDKRREGWILVEDAGFLPDISSTKLKLIPCLQADELVISSARLVGRLKAQQLVRLGQRHAEWLLEHQEAIPHEFSRYILVFTGTIWCFSSGARLIATLHYSRGQWKLSWGKFVYYDWNTGGLRIPVPCE